MPMGDWIRQCAVDGILDNWVLANYTRKYNWNNDTRLKVSDRGSSEYRRIVIMKGKERVEDTHSE